LLFQGLIYGGQKASVSVKIMGFLLLITG
jgi:hypothetical protein